MKKKILHVGHANTTLSSAMLDYLMYMEGQKPVDMVFAQQDSYEPEETTLNYRKSMKEIELSPITELIPKKLDYPQEMSERQARRKAERKLNSTVKAKYKGKTNPFKK